MFFGIYKEKNELFTLIMQIIKSDLIDPAVERGDDTINYYHNDDYYNKIESQIFNEAIDEMNLDILKKDNRLKDFVYIDNNINKIDAIDGIDINITNYGDIKKPNYFAIVKYIDQIFAGSTPIFSQYF